MAKVFKQGRLWSRNRDGSVSVSLKEGDIFTYKDDILVVMKDYCVQQGICLRKLRNDRRRYTKKCTNVDCTWRIHASVLDNKSTWMIRRHSWKHICGRTEVNKSASSRWVATHPLSYYSPYKGVLMTAMGLDENNGQFSLAYGIAPQENEEEWSCFVQALARALGARKNIPTYTIIKLYDNIIHPISDPCIWGETNLPPLDPPFELRKRGSPKKHKIRESQSWSQALQAEGQGSRHFSGTKRLTCGRSRDDSGRLVERYKRKNVTSGRPVGMPRKTPRAILGTSAGKSTSIVAPPSQSSRV
ncbi:hypothetical protein Cgig2_008377 [Carnegiea gigantea]|uniref:Transposase MuDR plant domain-containing protein n=1 Tax=Carnegiea gigantea TaxID=171969 RepID=A0A9Q1JR78_9CARY|nr:hypothetical protein Cgig2_008377 [Carnegiea gigantea]